MRFKKLTLHVGFCNSDDWEFKIGTKKGEHLCLANTN